MRQHTCRPAEGSSVTTRQQSWSLLLTLSRPFSMSLSMDLFSPSSSRSISLTVSPDRVLNFFLVEKQSRRSQQQTVNITRIKLYFYSPSPPGELRGALQAKLTAASPSDGEVVQGNTGGNNQKNQEEEGMMKSKKKEKGGEEKVETDFFSWAEGIFKHFSVLE